MSSPSNFASFKEVVCIKNLSDLKGRIERSVCSDEFPIIGKTYKIKDSTLPYPDSPHYDITFFEFKPSRDRMGQERTFRSSWFVPKSMAFGIFMAYGMNINAVGWREKVDEIYKNESWKPDLTSSVMPLPKNRGK